MPFQKERHAFLQSSQAALVVVAEISHKGSRSGPAQLPFQASFDLCPFLLQSPLLFSASSWPQIQSCLSVVPVDFPKPVSLASITAGTFIVVDSKPLKLFTASGRSSLQMPLLTETVSLLRASPGAGDCQFYMVFPDVSKDAVEVPTLHAQ